MVWDFDGWSDIVNIFVRTLRDARHNIGEMITGKPEKLADRQRIVHACGDAAGSGRLAGFWAGWQGRLEWR